VLPCLVLEKNPPKQGLKPFSKEAAMKSLVVLEKNPPKQGLKQRKRISFEDIETSF